MMRRVFCTVTLLCGCAWSNSLYQARVLSGQATQAEREQRPGEARQLWSQVVVKADSAYARDPEGARGAEALWLSGHASVRTDDCPRAIPRLNSAMSAGANAPWRQQLLFELALCEEPLGGPTAASLYATLIASARDPVLLRRARLRLGHTQVVREDWAGALSTLASEDTLPARIDRAMALAGVGSTDQSLTELAPLLAASDTSVRWLVFVEAFAVRNSAATDALLDRLLAAFPNAGAELKSRWLLQAARAALSFDPDAADRRLALLATRPRGAAVAEGLTVRQRLSITRTTTMAALRLTADSLAHAELSDDGFGARLIADLLRLAQQIIRRNDDIAPRSAQGDLAMFGLAELAHDSLGSVRLGDWFLARLEQQWPDSPYLGKALMARAAVEPDSAAEILVRLSRLGRNPYVAAANGDVAGRVRVTQLEDSLGRFVERMLTTRPIRQ